MLIFFRVFIVACIFYLGACAGTSQQPVEVEAGVQDVVVDQQVPVEKEVLTAIDPEVLYLLLTAEIAGQRSQYGVALDGYLRAAKRVDDPRIAERAAKIALYLKDKERVDEAVSLWIKQNPESLTARKIAVLTAFRDENTAAAIEHLNFLLKADPAGFEATLLELSKVLEAEGKGAFVYDVLDEMQVQHSDQAVIPFVQAILAMQMQQKDVAMEKVQAALQIQPDWSKALILQAQLVAQSGDLEKAEALIQQAVEKDPENERLKKLLASVYLKMDEPDLAIEVYQQIIKHNPDDLEAQYALALVYLQMEQYDKAKKLLIPLTHQPVWQAQASLLLGRVEAKNGNAENALVWFDKITTGPLVFEAGMSAVSMLITEHRYDEAIARLEGLRSSYPERRNRFVLLEADILNEQKQYEQSFELLSTALTEMPENKDLLYARALVAEHLDKLDVLESDLKKILQQYPNDANALNALGYTLADRTDRLLEAEQYLQRAIELQPDEPVIIDSYGWLQFRLGNYQQALTYLQRAYAGVKEGEIAAHLVETLWVVGRKNEARTQYRQAITEVSDTEPLLKLQQRIPGLK